MASQETQKQAYEFLTNHLRDGTAFSLDDLAVAGSWKLKSVRTYLSKQLKHYLRKQSDGRYKVKHIFRRFSTFEQFQPLVTQVKSPVSEYRRATHDNLVSYEFLLPLTQEGKLRSALDELFYTDTLDALVRDLHEDDPAILGEFVQRGPGETDDQLFGRAVERIGRLFSGYSISHVGGRFRASEITSRDGAANRLRTYQRYLIDETTAAVRFIIPCDTGRIEHGERFRVSREPVRATSDGEPLDKEIAEIRSIFLSIFVEAIVREVQGEDLIWLLEETPHGSRLYALEKE